MTFRKSLAALLIAVSTLAGARSAYADDVVRVGEGPFITGGGYFVAEGKGSMACDIGPYYSAAGDIQVGYDHPLDLGPNVRRKISGGEIAEY